jgi:uncharacterized protein
MPVLGVMPRSPLLRSVTVEELARRLQAQVLCCHDRLDLLVETLSIGAMNVNSAMEFFRRRRNMAVVTGADRTDIQLAALEASTQCLILTGAGDPLPQLVIPGRGAGGAPAEGGPRHPHHRGSDRAGLWPCASASRP